MPNRIVHTNFPHVAQNEANASDILNFFACDRNVTVTTTTLANCATTSLLYKTRSDPQPTTLTAGVLVVNDQESMLP